MPLPQSLPDGLDEYLTSISAEALAALIAEIEDARRPDGRADEVGELVLKTARRLVREGRLAVNRVVTPRRLFCGPLEPFLADGTMPDKQRGRIERGSLGRIHQWLERDLLPERMPELTRQARAELAAGDMKAAERTTARMRGAAIEAIRPVLAECDKNERMRRRMAAHVGGAQALEDARDTIDIFEHGVNLRAFSSLLPKPASEFDEAQQLACMETIDRFAKRHPHMVPIALAAAMARLAQPAQALRLAARAVGTDEAERLATHPYGAAGELVLHDIERSARNFIAGLDSRLPYADIRRHFTRYHALAQGLQVESEMARDDAWAVRLSQVRKLISERLAPEVSATPRVLKASLLQRQNSPVHVPDEADLEAAEFAINLMRDIRLFVSELALNDLVSRTAREVDLFMNYLGDFIVERLRRADPAEHAAAAALLDGAVRLTRLACGDVLADLLHRGGSGVLQELEPLTEAG